jgi:rhodanese-related sulfurtransferase
MKNIRPSELSRWLQSETPAPQLLDVREPWELAHCRLENVISIPLGQVPARASELDPALPVVCICHHGMRSMQVAVWLERSGFSDVYNLTGGVAGWASEVDPGFPTY